MTAKPTAAAMLTLYASNRTCVGFIIGRGRQGYETYDAEERSLGVFATAAEAANALTAASNDHEQMAK
jgi:hypothetical protein